MAGRASKVSWMAAASVGAVEALKDQAGLCRWNYVFRYMHKHAKNNVGSVSKANGSKTMSLVERLREDNGKASEESLRKVMYLSCWGPN